jgi:arylsulfatase A-like enzyme
VGAVNAALEQRFQAGKLVLGASASALVLDRKQLAARGLALDTVADSAREALLAQPQIAAAYTREELASGSRAGAPLFEAMRKAWHPEVSGDVQFALRPHWMFGNAGATHGSPYEYDTHVPLLAWGPHWVQPGRRDARVEVADLAPTLAAVLRVPAPAGSEGRPLRLDRRPSVATP